MIKQRKLVITQTITLAQRQDKQIMVQNPQASIKLLRPALRQKEWFGCREERSGWAVMIAICLMLSHLTWLK